MSSPATPLQPAFRRVFHPGVARRFAVSSWAVPRCSISRRTAGRLFLLAVLQAAPPSNREIRRSARRSRCWTTPAGRWQLDREYGPRAVAGDARVGDVHPGRPRQGASRSRRRCCWPRPRTTAATSTSTAGTIAPGTWTRTHLGTGGQRRRHPQLLRLSRQGHRPGARVFAGTVPLGLFSGTYDPDAPGQIRWDARPELDGYTRRPMAFAECNGRLYTTIKPDMYRRIDGPSPRWEKVYTIPGPVIIPSCGLARAHGRAPARRARTRCCSRRWRAIAVAWCASIRRDGFPGGPWSLRCSICSASAGAAARGMAWWRTTTSRRWSIRAPGRRCCSRASARPTARRVDWHPPDGWTDDAWYLIRHPDGPPLRRAAHRGPGLRAPADPRRGAHHRGVSVRAGGCCTSAATIPTPSPPRVHGPGCTRRRPEPRLRRCEHRQPPAALQTTTGDPGESPAP